MLELRGCGPMRATSLMVLEFLRLAPPSLEMRCSSLASKLRQQVLAPSALDTMETESDHFTVGRAAPWKKTECCRGLWGELWDSVVKWFINVF